MVGRLKSRIFVFLFKDRIICAFIAHEIVKLPLPKISFFKDTLDGLGYLQGVLPFAN